VSIVERVGIVLVYPIANRAEPPSLWSELHPGSPMSWSWDQDADDRVVELWQMREKLARSGDVAYAKWFRGRATFFSLPVFHALLGAIAAMGDPLRGLPPEALTILESLRERSPQSTKEIRSEAGLRGKQFESAFTQAMKALWTRLLVVGTGEIDDGAFPSLAVAATEHMFEDLWLARGNVPATAKEKLEVTCKRHPVFDKEVDKSLREVHSATLPTSTRARTSEKEHAAVLHGDQDDALDPGVSMRDEAEPRHTSARKKKPRRA